MRAAEARAAIEADDPSRALATAVAVWRDTRNPVVAEVALHLAKQVSYDGPRPRTKDAFQEAWMEVARAPDLAAVGWLAQTLNEKVPLDEDRFASFQTGYQERRYRAWLDRLAALARLPPDPRIGDAMMTVLEESKLSVGWLGEVETVYGPVVEVLERSADAGLIARAHALAERPRAAKAAVREWITGRCAELVAPRALELEDRAGWEALRPRPERPELAAAELLDAVRADPSDLGIRAVYADVLQESGDPRGAFIALQLRGDADAAKQAATLFRKHGSEWLGPDLSRVLTGVVMRHGFLYRTALAQNAAADAAGWERSYDDERLATLVRLEKGRGNTTHYTRFLLSPAARALSDVEIPASAVLDALLACEHPRAIETLRIGRLPGPKVLRVLASHPWLAGLKAMGLSCASPRGIGDGLQKAVQALRKHGLERVREILVIPGIHMAPVAEAAPWFEPLGLDRLTIGHDDHSVTLRRTPDGIDLEVTGVGAMQVGDAARAVGGSIRHVTLVDPLRRHAYMLSVDQLVSEVQRMLPGVPVEVVTGD
ncbi:MAG: TIGR02996 domain-containing protein [Alphaproteobacteria bacterium]|nr:TIGR02996 domain-containing protein [Alphaproteobacteria bacterium]